MENPGDRVGQPLDPGDEERDRGPAAADDEQRRQQADECAGADVGRIVEAEDDPEPGEDEGDREEDAADRPVVEVDRPGDPEGRARVVARERGVVGVGERVPDARVRVVGPRAVPACVDELVQRVAERARGERRCRRGAAPSR